MAAIDLPAYIADIKDHAVEHGFHVHDERHFVETYSLRQSWEIDLHPEEACGGPIDLHIALEVDPRVLLGFEEAVMMMEDPLEKPADAWWLSLHFNWSIPPLTKAPDLLVLATDLAGIGETVLPIEVSATDTFASVTDQPHRSLQIVGKTEVSLSSIFMAKEGFCEELDRAHAVSTHLLSKIHEWVDDAEAL